MARALHRLTARQVVTLKKIGRHADGGGLYLRITNAGARSWVFIATTNGKRSEIGLGAAATVSLAVARRIAADMRDAMAAGGDPRTVIAPVESAPPSSVPTFGIFAEEYIASVESGWRNPVHRQQWRQSLRDHASGLTALPIDSIGTDDVLAVLQPIWLTHAETASRVRGRIEKILDAAKVRGHRPRDAANPASWRGHLELLLPPRPKLQRGHHAALAWKDAPTFITALVDREAPAALCLQFLILTAARSGEALGATWAEIDWDESIWTVPKERMKAGQEHTVPLCRSAIILLERLKPEEPKTDALIFAVRGAARSNMAMSMLLRRMGYSHITVHGFRSTFRDWAGEATEFPRELIEHALAHTIQNKAERAYRRGTSVERRRGLMQAWDDYLFGKTLQKGAAEAAPDDGTEDQD